MNSQRLRGKRGLREVLEAGLAREEEKQAKLVTVVFDVLSSSGDRFGLAMHDRFGKPIYVDPTALQGVEVVFPMTLRATPNPRCLAAALSVAIKGELCR